MLTRADVQEPLYALTWWQPWGWAMFHGKPVENRGWHPPRWLIGRVVAVHAGKKYEAEAERQISALTFTGDVDGPCPPKSAIALGAVIGVARLAASLTYRDTPPVLPQPPASGPCGCSGISHREACPYLSPWFCGPIGWVFEEPREFADPIPAKGRQGLWSVDGEVLDQLLAAMDH